MAKGTYKFDSSINWEKAKNFIPKENELIYYYDLKQVKIGNGITKVNDLPFLNNNTDIYQGEMRIIDG